MRWSRRDAPARLSALAQTALPSSQPRAHTSSACAACPAHFRRQLPRLCQVTVRAGQRRACCRRDHLAWKGVRPTTSLSPDLAMNSPRPQLLATSRLHLATSASATFCSEFHSCAIVKLTTTSSTVSRALSEVHYASFSRSEHHCSVLLTRSGGGVFQVYFRCISGGPQAKA